MIDVEPRGLGVEVIAPASSEREHEVLVRSERGWEQTIALRDTQLFARGRVAAALPSHVLVATSGEHPRGGTFHEARLHCIDASGEIVWSREQHVGCNVLTIAGRFVTVQGGRRPLRQPALFLERYAPDSDDVQRQEIPFPDSFLVDGRPTWSAISAVELRASEVVVRGTVPEVVVSKDGAVLLTQHGVMKRHREELFVWRVPPPETVG